MYLIFVLTEMWFAFRSCITIRVLNQEDHRIFIYISKAEKSLPFHTKNTKELLTFTQTAYLILVIKGLREKYRKYILVLKNLIIYKIIYEYS